MYGGKFRWLMPNAGVCNDYILIYATSRLCAQIPVAPDTHVDVLRNIIATTSARCFICDRASVDTILHAQPNVSDTRIVVMDSVSSTGGVPFRASCDKDTYSARAKELSVNQMPNGVQTVSMRDFEAEVHLRAPRLPSKRGGLLPANQDSSACHCQMAPIFVPVNPTRHVTALLFTSGSSGKPKGAIYTDDKMYDCELGLSAAKHSFTS